MLCMAEDKVRHSIDGTTRFSPFSAAARTFAISGLFALIVRWHVRQSADGIFARPPCRLQCGRSYRQPRTIFSGMNPVAEGYWLRCNRSSKFPGFARVELAVLLRMHQPSKSKLPSNRLPSNAPTIKNSRPFTCTRCQPKLAFPARAGENNDLAGEYFVVLFPPPAATTLRPDFPM